MDVLSEAAWLQQQQEADMVTTPHSVGKSGHTLSLVSLAWLTSCLWTHPKFSPFTE